MQGNSGRQVSAVRGWTEDDDNLLIELAAAHTPRAEIAQMLHRLPGAVSSRLYKLRQERKVARGHDSHRHYSPAMADQDRRAAHAMQDREFVRAMFKAGFGAAYTGERAPRPL